MKKLVTLKDAREGNLLFTLSDIARFFSKFEKGADCWNWTGLLTATGGYSTLRVRGLDIGGHVISYLIHYGPIPNKLFVCHSCDNPKCVNPSHLWLGTNMDNMQDKRNKGREVYPPIRHGADSSSSKLSAEDVLEIKKCIKAGAKQTDMARRFGVKGSTISLIARGKTWRDNHKK